MGVVGLCCAPGVPAGVGGGGPPGVAGGAPAGVKGVGRAPGVGAPGIPPGVKGLVACRFGVELDGLAMQVTGTELTERDACRKTLPGSRHSRRHGTLHRPLAKHCSSSK